MDRIQRRMEDAQRQISSGLKLERASDEPSQVMALVQLENNQTMNTQLRANLEREKTETNVADSALQNAVRLMDRALTLGAQSAGSLSTAEQRLLIGEEVTGILARLVAISQTTVNGRYIFSGDLDQTPSYALDPAASGEVLRLQYAPATREVLEPGGTTFVASKTAHEIFDSRDAADAPTQKNVFHALSQFVTALQTNDGAAIEQAIDAMRAASVHLNTSLSYYGVSQNRIEAAITTANRYELQFGAEISHIRDADLAEAAIEMSQADLHHKATLAAHANYRRQSLFDYLG
jgi:flagellar hook-associated protein 3 FlgL